MIPRLLKWLLLASVTIVLGVLVAVSVLQQPIGGPGPNASDTTRIHDPAFAGPAREVSNALEGYRAALESPSVSLAVGVQGRLVLSAARGFADLETRVLATPDTVYAIGSASKPITAALTLALWEDGVLDLDSDVREYVPDFPAKRYPITLRQLLSHQAGVRHYAFRPSLPTFSESDLDREFASTAESLGLFASDPLRFEPDTGFEYSTYGYTLVAAAIEQATGQAYEEVLAARLLQPLRMTGTSIDSGPEIRSLRATDYVASFAEAAVLPAPSTNSSYKRAGGGLAATTADLVRFGNALLGDELLGAASRAAMFTPRTLRNGQVNPQRYGLGWRIGGLVLTDEAGGEERIIPLWHHGGTRAGSTAILMIVPDYGIVVAMAANTVGRGASGPITSIAADVARVFIRFQSPG